MIRFLNVLFILLLASGRINGQFSEVSVDRDFNSSTLTELINYIEVNHDLKFFYLKKWTDSINVIQRITPSSLEQVLKESLLNTKVTYFADNQRNIILSYQYKIESGPLSFLLTEDKGNRQETQVLEKSSFINNKQTVSIPLTIQNELITIGTRDDASRSSLAIISGVILEKETGQPLIGAVVYIKDLNLGTTTDKYGYYILSVPRGEHDLFLKYMGRRDKEMKILVNGNGTLDQMMEERILELRGVVIYADKELNINGLQIGFEKLDVQMIKQVSSTMGEGDLIKTVLLLPGVQTVGEGTSGINVRGGSTDQNLILLDGSPLFNSSHVFGFFSVFNPDIIKEFKLYKSGIPAQYGGRLSSVLDISTKNGNLKKISFYGGISPVTGRLSLEGPIVKDKASFLISSRSSYSDWVLRKTDISALKNSAASFLDLNAKIYYNINEKNLVTVSGYYSEDHFKLHSDTLYNYNNLNGCINLKHLFSKKLYGLLSGIYSKYTYSVRSEKRIPYSFNLSYLINYLEGRTDFTWYLNSNHKLNFGTNIIKYNLNPGTLNPTGTESLIAPRKVPEEQAVETGLYISDEYSVTNALSLSYGLRYSGFFTLGPALEYKYMPDAPRSFLNRIDSTYYLKNKITNYEGGPEFRLTGRYRTGISSSIKVSYTKMFQYLQMISNTTAISPTDMWKVSGPNIPAQKSRQISIGFYKDLMSNSLESSIEAYYKISDDILEYRGGTILLMNPDLEVDLLNGKGKAYGVEILFKKKYGAINGWVSYTYSRSLIKVDSKYLIDQINQGDYFPSNYDKPHDFTIVANYRFSQIHSISSTLTYSTGRPITYPVAKYQFRDRELIHYSNRNEYRIPDYFRWDISLNIEGRLWANKLIHDSMFLSIYNLTGRDNTYSIYFVSDESKNVKGYKLSVFSQPIVSLTYNFRF